MKKNTMMRLASVLLIAVLMSTCAISGTFAKYVTSDEGTDTARVAKFGVTVEAKNFGMFEADYKTDDNTAKFTGAYSVSAAEGDRDDLLAPGTSGSFADIAITGTSEVAVDVAIVATVTISDKWSVAGKFYCPVVVTVGTKAISGLDYTSAADFAKAIKDEIDGKSKQYAPNTDLGTEYNSTNLDLAWAWAFETGADDATKAENNKKDTALGKMAAAGDDLTISIGVSITVTQID